MRHTTSETLFPLILSKKVWENNEHTLLMAKLLQCGDFMSDSNEQYLAGIIDRKKGQVLFSQNIECKAARYHPYMYK